MLNCGAAGKMASRHQVNGLAVLIRGGGVLSLDRVRGREIGSVADPVVSWAAKIRRPVKPITLSGAGGPLLSPYLTKIFVGNNQRGGRHDHRLSWVVLRSPAGILYRGRVHADTLRETTRPPESGAANIEPLRT